MEFVKNIFQELLKKKDQLMQFSKLSVLLSDPFTFFFMCIFLFFLTSIMTYLYCFCKGYEKRKSPRVHTMSKKVK
ncbi:conserved Plasmodium protein, unknown function [Plasmodium knowlesi strain H]|uniref:Uncharacterized protein n=3 Tax=Plasmodium knowlesi TaxID=5850 RepID=A0A5E7X6S7_PLAKH|nr:conserved Plasmodium protein, unknown function [Plasmodium knowlesi strain H]OTN67746.1 Uncharacterized protein PKNOH_S05388800 [Plasmodium knowlesi]CAA9990475.1 conserved Plasmodium protein, unknown function [Plasmodium knowlesi strain H]SBO19689.1 conserved Plasmodium protein, unknown function [Plasmodium knowlesi strain H]SBO22488.1 conserved Plasmodium protein, unknown function [Plasmodium knowlesi strain H]VVS79949.1 conserved Plasmodium protein, unknown function [Plasmodium knowlesi s